jgi:hypothetical protein
MNSLQGFMFLIVLIIIIVLIFTVKIMYDIWATSVTLNLFKNNQNNFSVKRFIIWIGVMLFILFIFSKMKKNKE